jgi:hypothetical protein
VIVNLNSDKKEAQSLNNAYEGKISRYEVEVGDLKEQVYETQLRVADKQRELELTIEQVERLDELNIRNVQMIGSLRLSLKAYQDSLAIRQGPDTIVLTKYVRDSTGVFEVPEGSTWGWEDEYASSYAGIDKYGYGYSGFDVKPFEIDISLGSRGVFRKDYVSAITTDMPYMDVTGIDMQVVKQKNRGLKGFLIGGAIGGIVTGLLLSL